MSIISATSYATAHETMSSTNYSTAVSMESFFDAHETMPETMMMPEWLIDVEAKNANDIKAIMASLSEREKIETVVYLFMQVKHYRAGDYDAYVGDDEFSYNELALFSPYALIDAAFSNDVAIYKQAPERSGKTLQLLLDTLICVHRNWVGMIGVGSPRDNVIGVYNGLDKACKGFENFISAHYPKTNAAFKDVFGKFIHGPMFKFFDGSSTSFAPEDMGFILSGKIIPVFSAMKPQPIKAMFKVFNAIKAAGKSYFINLDEADSVIRPIASSMTKKMAVSIETILGMRENVEITCACGDVHVCCHSATEKEAIGTFGGAKKIMLLSATMNLPVEFFNVVGANRPKVMMPYTERAISLIGGVNEHNAIVSTDQLSHTTGYFASTNPETSTGRFSYFIAHDCMREQGEDGHRSLRSFWNEKPFMPIGAEAPGKFKTNSVLLIQLTSLVNGGRQNADAEADLNQKDILAKLCGGLDSQGIIRDGSEGRALGVLPDTIFITFFAGGAKIRGENKVDKSVKDIIRGDDLYAKIKETIFDEPGYKAEALKVVKTFETADEDVENTMKFVSWYYGLHRPVVVITFNKGQRAVDMRDRHHVISHMLMHASDTRGADSLKQQAGRTKGAKGEFLKCNYPSEFVPTIVCNKSLAVCKTHEQLPFYNEVDDNGKRIIPRENMLAIEADRVLDKVNKNFEPKTRMMQVITEEALHDFDTDNDDTFVLILADGSEFVFTPENIVDFDITLMPGATNILKCAQKAWILQKFDIKITSKTIYGGVSNSGKNKSITTLINDGFFTLVGFEGRTRMVAVNSVEFPRN
jgi:hypothetical protein